MTSRAILLILAAAMIVPLTESRGDSTRVRTARGTYLVEVADPGITVRGDGNDLVVARPGGDEIRLTLDAQRGDHVTEGSALVIRRDGKVIVSASRLPDAMTTSNNGPEQRAFKAKVNASAWSLALAPDGKTLASGHNGFLRIWDLPSGVLKLELPTGKTVRRVAFAADGATIVEAEYSMVDGKPIGNVVARDPVTGKVRFSTKPTDTGLHCVTVDPAGKVVVSSSWGEPDLRVWDFANGEQIGTLRGHTGPVGTVVYSPDGKTLASGGDSTIRLWDVDTGETRSILRGHQHSVESVAFSSDGKLVASGGFDTTARVWDPVSGRLVATVEHEDPVLSVAMSPDGKLVASAAARWGSGFFGQAPAEVRVSDAATGKTLTTLPRQSSQIFAMAFTIDGKGLITASLSGAVILWDLARVRTDGTQP